jgi:hypothetical protein
MNSCTETDCTIYSNGNVSCMHPCDHSAYCDEADYTNWPHDVQRCNFEFISRTRNTKNLKFSNHSVWIDNELVNSDWDLLSASSITGSRRYMFDGYNSSHPFIVFNFSFRRHSGEFSHQVMIPAAVLGVVNLVLLLLSPESKERFILLAMNLFSHFIYMEQLRWMWVLKFILRTISDSKFFILSGCHTMAILVH